MVSCAIPISNEEILTIKKLLKIIMEVIALLVKTFKHFGILLMMVQNLEYHFWVICKL